MFKNIRRKLTLLYAGLFFCLLLAFAAVTVTGATWSVLYELKQEVHLLAHEEAEEQLAVLRAKGVFADSDEDEHNPEGLFYYIVNANGAIVANATPPRLQSRVLEEIQNWHEEPTVAILKKVTLGADKKPTLFLLTAEPIMDETTTFGTVYFGKDITPYYRLFCWIIAALFVILLLFLLLAIVVGYVLAGRAMIPIVQSFTRQREFTADASHELRTPLSILMASADAIQSDDQTRLSSFSSQVLDDMREEIRKMTKLVSNLLTLARADSGVTELQLERFDLQQAASTVIRTLQPLVQEKGLHLHFDAPMELLITADRERIQQLLFILLDNAVKYTPSGGEIRLTLTQNPPHGSIKITVADTGLGIAKEEQAKIFERFYRSDKARSRALGGTGLGLSIAAWIAASHGGSIAIESELGHGAAFIVTLPKK